ncbi:MAG: hypothetical protein V8R80_09490 [Eubacterium sp.]
MTVPRKKIADTIVNGKRLVIEGGNIAICEYAGDCCGNCGKQECKVRASDGNAACRTKKVRPKMV